MSAATLHHGDCLDVLRTLPDASIDAVVTDPPYGLAEHKPATITAAMVAWCSGDRDHVPDGRGFMGRAWDGFVPPPAVWDECLRVLKPGGHLLAFAGSRTADLMGMSVRLAGFEIRDTIVWHYASGFPKSLDVSKAIDKAGGGSPVEHGRVLRTARERAGISRQDVATAVGCKPQSVGDWEDGRARALGEPREVCVPSPAYRAKLADLLGYTDDERTIAGVGRKAGPLHGYGHGEVLYGGAATDAARQWQGWGTALKPASEPIIVARKPLGGTVAATVLAHGTGALNIDATRVAGQVPVVPQSVFGGSNNNVRTAGRSGELSEAHTAGRWPSNVVLTHAPECGPDDAPGECVDGCPVAELDAQSGITRSSDQPRRNTAAAHNGTSSMGKSAADWTTGGHADSGGASRFFPTFRYQAKAGTRERPKVWVPSPLRLRADLSDEQRAYVLAELTKAGVDVA